MISLSSIQEFSKRPSFNKGLSADMRRFSAGMRVITALLCTMLLMTGRSEIGFWSLVILQTYCLWAGLLLWIEASGQVSHSGLWLYGVDIVWSCLTMKLWSSGALMILTLVHPVVMATIGFGVLQGLLLALLASAGMLIDTSSELMRGPDFGWPRGIQILFILTLVPAVALVARPINVRFRWLALLGELEAKLDPRHGLVPVCASLVKRLLQATQADVVALVLPSSRGDPSMLASREDGSFCATAQVHERLEFLLSKVPNTPVSHMSRPWWDPRPSTWMQTDQPLPEGLSAQLAELARTLEVSRLHIVPLTRYTRQHGYLVIGYTRQHGAANDVAALINAAPELLRMVEQATLVDLLQEETAAHERSRIGRDLHDSAIQPYLGLKYAVESVALRIPPDNPARAELDSLAQLVNGEVAALRELISNLRSDNQHGDNTLVPAIRRQVRRFSALFGIEVELNCPASIPTTRTLASSVFHLVNEVLNNIRKHTPARRIWISMAVQNSKLGIVVRDDAGSLQGHPADLFDPVSLRERTAELKGTLQISQPDKLNTELTIQIPL